MNSFQPIFSSNNEFMAYEAPNQKIKPENVSPFLSIGSFKINLAAKIGICKIAKMREKLYNVLNNIPCSDLGYGR